MATYLNNKSKIDFSRIVFLFISIVISIFAGINGQQFIHMNKDAVDIIINTFSILAGFLMTALTFVIEPKPGAKIWRADAARRQNFHNRLVRYKWLFVIYLLVLGLAFITMAVGGDEKKQYTDIIIFLEKVYLSLACFAFLVSLSLPGQLMKFQMERYEELIEAKKKGEPE
ncbi:Uncharacterised protein [Pseudomonas luteola]|uniref:Transmembrane protein n=1 Tax=Pseudomonas luteola TaxID=47886 RepID=A0A2X2ELP0_PSELU|nr:hypothetical protein [Pseudomonas luteola]SPZ07590.1 Uncharacterised protein [Pseudomonas luteola]